ncbi:Nif3-like dinuclear metal center hexameric protein [Mycoplasma sp. 'Moose RK']|uniref:Nif3-like dinuclear metal center hexameric protein n=1 Tax=Mycoplasma sp. 'Moose RK' TaxID=2780095 RepID=UPI0018C30752|nr:Nif3-like dinuclear metal center hexameric protein [Mycoplasma sp. 'Moose RK']MBG0731032.1 Nif3-like dinuclear metal center hexameric protein [Mycoplasma sp. 'Moose RK']
MKTELIGNFLLEKFPLSNCQKWDNCGWNLFFDSQFKGLIICIDVTKEVLEFAIKNDCNLIISHHPFFFYPTKKEEFLYAPYKKNLNFLLKKHKISVFSLHTNFDGTENATAFSIAKILDLKFSKVEKIDEFNLLFHVKLKYTEILKKFRFNANLETFISNIEQNFLIKKLAILPGSGGILPCFAAKKMKADLVITSDLKWSDQLAIFHRKINVLQISHLIEQSFIEEVVQILTTKFAKIKILKFHLTEILKREKILC